MFTINAENAAIVQRLKDRICELPVEGTFAYIEANRVAGRDVQNKRRDLLQKAIVAAEKDIGCIFDTVRGVGIKRLSAAASPEIGLSTIRGVRRKARRGAQRLERINSNSLSEAERKRTIAYGSLLGAIAMMADGNKARTLAAVAPTAGPIPPKDVLQIMLIRLTHTAPSARTMGLSGQSRPVLLRENTNAPRM